MHRVIKRPLTRGVFQCSNGRLSNTYCEATSPPLLNRSAMPRSPVTHSNIRDVAQAAGVSTATVSRVLGGVGYVSEKSRKSVEKAMQRLNYTPSQVARSLRKQRSPIIGLIVTDIKNPYYPELVGGIEDQLRKRAYSLILCNTQDDSEREENYLNFLLSQRVAGIIICSTGLVRRHLNKLNAFGKNIVLVDVNTNETNFPVIRSDGHEGGVLVGKHLVECNYEEIVYLGFDLEKGDGSPRYSGLIVGCAGIPTHYFSVGNDFSSMSKVIDEIVSKVNTPFAVFAHNDISAIAAMHALKSRGLRIPEDVGIVGYDDISIASLVSPELTTIKHFHEQLGALAVETLEKLISNNGTAISQKISPKLVIRSSTATLKKKK